MKGIRISTFGLLTLIFWWSASSLASIQVGDHVEFDLKIETAHLPVSYDVYSIDVLEFSPQTEEYKIRTAYSSPNAVDEGWYSVVGLEFGQIAFRDEDVSYYVAHCDEKNTGHSEQIITEAGSFSACTISNDNAQNIGNTISLAPNVPLGIVKRVIGPVNGTLNTYTLKSFVKGTHVLGQ